jgi:hypothetical protein
MPSDLSRQSEGYCELSCVHGHQNNKRALGSEILPCASVQHSTGTVGKFLQWFSGGT